MLLLDTRTMIFTFATGSLIMAIGLLIVNVRSAHMRLMTLWVSANFVLFGAWALYALRDLVPALHSAELGFVLFCAGYALEFEALSMFAGRRMRAAPFIMLIVVGIVVGAVVHTAAPLVLAAWLGASALTLIIGASPEERTARWMAAGFFAAVALADAANAVWNTGLAQSTVLAINYIGLFGTSLGFVLITKERADNELIRTASVDGLTGLLNRRKFVESARRELHRAERQHLQTSVLMLDLDHFKVVNDTYGHPIGDLVLQSFGNVLHGSLRPFDVVGRYGGEEFCVLLPGTGIGEATQIAERLRAIASQTPVNARSTMVSYTVSTGVVQAPPRPVSLEELVDRADQALYEAKAAGRNCVRAV
jgi:diguanylate cyclase (GGDEF)-like protein